MKLLKSLVCLTVVFQFAVAQFVSVQGVIRDNDSNSIPDGDYTITFKLYSAESGGSASWTEEQTLTVTNGVYGAQLGAVTSLTSLNWETQFWLEIASITGASFSTNEALSPRTRLTMTPYAILAGMNGTTNVMPQDGNVGIGTTSPSFILDVNSGNNPIRIGPNSSYSRSLLLGGWGNSTSEAWVRASNGNLHLDSKSGNHIYLNHYHSGNTFLNAGGGRVGIGTTSPSVKLHTVSSSNEVARFEDNRTDHLTFIKVNSQYGSGRFGTYWNYPAILRDDNNFAYYYDTNNNRSVLKGAIIAENSDIYFSRTNHNHTGTGNQWGWAAIENASNYNALMILGRTGGEGGGRNVEIWDRLQVNGSFVNSSDGRLKKEITKLPSQETLSKLMRLRGVSYKWKEDKFETWVDESTHIGFIAQEIAQEYPEMVSENGMGNKGVSYISMIPVLLEGIKEVKAEKDREKFVHQEQINDLISELEEKDRAIEKIESELKRVIELLEN